MASIDNTSSSNLTTKLSPLIVGQVPDFVQSDHPLFVKFLKNYYEYLEAGELRVTVTIDDLLLETESPPVIVSTVLNFCWEVMNNLGFVALPKSSTRTLAVALDVLPVMVSFTVNLPVVPVPSSRTI